MTGRLSHIELDEASDHAPAPEIEQEQKVAIFDLLEDNRFVLTDGPEGPYRLRLGLRGAKLNFTVTSDFGPGTTEFGIAMGQLRQVVKDYTAICESYFEAVKSQGPAEIETLDEARRGIHHEGARHLQDLLAGKADTDTDTARRLFTLVCALEAAG